MTSRKFRERRACVYVWAVFWLLATLMAMAALTPWDLEIAWSFKDSWSSSFGEFVQDWGRKPVSLLVIGAAFLLTSKRHRIQYPNLSRASAALLVQLVVHPALLTNAIKLLAGRVRPVHLDAAAENYRPFFHWSPGVGDFSFPSGHVAVVMVLVPCVIQLFLLRRRFAGWLLGLVLAVWVAAVAYGRVMYGAHYLTDVVFSIGVGMALGPVSLTLADRFFKRKESSP